MKQPSECESCLIKAIYSSCNSTRMRAENKGNYHAVM